MPTDAEITFADHMGRFYARRYAFPPMVGRLLGYLAVCDPPKPSIGELAEALLASRSAIAGAVKTLETIHAIRRSRVAGERMDRVRITAPQSTRLDVTEYQELRDLAREGLEVLGTLRRSGGRCCWRCRRSPTSWSSGCRGCKQEWEAQRRGARASGDLPETRSGHRRQP